MLRRRARQSGPGDVRLEDGRFRRRRMPRVRLALVALALGLFGLHGLYHLWQWLAWPPPDVLEVLYGHSEVGRYIHVLTEAIVALALFLALKDVLQGEGG